MASIDRRIAVLEAQFGPASLEDEGGRRPSSGGRLMEPLEESFERSMRHAKARLDAGDARPLGPGAAPITAAAFYAVLASRGDPRAEEARARYAEISERRRRHHTAVELEEKFPGIVQAHRKRFAEMVERHARPPGS